MTGSEGVNTSLFIDVLEGENLANFSTNASSGNFTYISIMRDNSVNALCDGLSQNTSMCNKKGLGISLSTPILMNSAGILGNFVALMVLYTARREMKKTMFYVLLCGLAGTDLLGQLMTGPIAIIVYANNLQWVGGDPLCKYHGFFMVCFGMITPLLVCCLSIERVTALRFPYYYERSVTKKKVVGLILSCWAFVLIFCCMPFIGFGSYAHQFPGSWCFLNFHRESTSDEAYAYTYAFINVIIISVIIIGNSLVMVTLVQMKKKKLKKRNLTSSPSTERRNGSQRKSKLKVEEETQMIWFLFAITIVFTTCWFPLNIHILINQVTGRINYPADLIGVRLASINVILDPWLYILLRKSVIVKAFRFIKNLFFKDKSLSPKRSTRYITNYSQNQIPKGSIHEREDREGHELGAIDQTCNQVKEFDKRSACSDTSSSSSSAESDSDMERRYLKQVRKRSRLSDSGLTYQKKNSYESCNGFNRENDIPVVNNRKTSLPARISRD
ncbi:prostaglandin E2 receptor EP4 subtype-like [Mercenaria mercenaria]|uniref:prostaglandin E2 receptor EP4 subtype-like n=1 Tax=Mercenaria mercenaria TaxID=6596 RepID=UPI001E1DFAAA|nr:prostaglandin E2 receptor EP4 subtype-like [Mercenaria mercenaria]XP_045158909.1 prostaglandin E2 receptor EP4 subtype-like [Mercenaria mercenaria]XP_045158910.1 prostaglandin E2 receptor EP4 subtype-like [Mercenaria mercenaria]XP_045158912.1 prostaglandin E2 receptor EP4 subtype-like [Mercenaria mercenaria]XP_045158913.1 prostaglandin E2 receptor EP4 subtype-like [Mercenaria mercenaria]XP_045158914.1 prostaglandin E2 receptor EP4 subtype-like [Mercenaria mercenaria]XP_045158915.1 prostagl